MCGVPVHADEAYLPQPDPPRLPGRDLRADGGPGRGEEARRQVGGAARGGAGRDAGTLTEDSAARRAAAQLPGRAGRGGAARSALAWLDLSTGDSRSQPVAPTRRSPAALARLDAAARSWCRSGCWQRRTCSSCSATGRAALTPLPNPRFDSENGRRRLRDAFTASRRSTASAASAGPELAAAGALVDYVELTQKGKAAAPRRRRARLAPRRGAWRSTPRRGATSS